VNAVKIGAGGLQSYATHDDVALRQAQESRRPDYQQKPASDSDAAAALNRDMLNKTVERLNDASQAYDLPLRFAHKKNSAGQDFIEMLNTRTGAKKRLEPEKAGELLNKMQDSRGLNIDEYI
jgi:uncharacterized FlaG/YvyC family protein